MHIITEGLWSREQYGITYELEIRVQRYDAARHFHLYFRYANTATRQHADKRDYYLENINALRATITQIFYDYPFPFEERKAFFDSLDRLI